MGLDSYQPGEFYDELFLPDGSPREIATTLIDKIGGLSLNELQQYQQLAQSALLTMGVTFNVYSDARKTEKILPFDIIPRAIDRRDWEWLERGLQQRIHALNLFLSDIYGQQQIIRDGVIPQELIYSAKGFLQPCMGLKPPQDIWCHITGTDLIRDRDGSWYVLEDNLRCPSGVSYVLENRRVMKSTFPKLFEKMQILPVEDYPSKLLDTLLHLAPASILDPTVVVLTPGIHNSAYFEHSFLAQQMGVQLVEPRDLTISNGFLQMRTTKGLQQVDVVYRRIDDIFIDPLVFRADSLLGVPGLMDVYRSGKVAIANAPGTGVADDKVIYAYLPAIVKYYLDEEQIVPNVPTYECWQPSQQDYVLANLDKLVVKAACESGGYGMLIGTKSTPAERDEFAAKIVAQPRNYIAQPTLCLSRVPTLCADGIDGRHVDLRPYILNGKDIYINPGGLTRVALQAGSLVVNSSQGGGTKDTWVINN
jgi:uncharacterized circularly permuted ATP-grasp superfamily protein